RPLVAVYQIVVGHRQVAGSRQHLAGVTADIAGAAGDEDGYAFHGRELSRAFVQEITEIGDGHPQPVVQRHPRLPAQIPACPRDVRLALYWVVGRERAVDEPRFGSGQLDDLLSELSNGPL